MVTPKSRSRVRQEHSYTKSTGNVGDELEVVKAKLQYVKQKYRLLKAKLNRRDAANFSLKAKVEELCSVNQLDALEEKFPEVLKTIISNEKQALSVKGKSRVTYTEEMRKFSATLHYYSPKCYTFLRDHLNLPHPGTINSWMKSSDCGPGFNVDVISKLGQIRRNDTKNLMTEVSLMIDEMAIKKDLVWNPSKGKYEGHINYGTSDAADDPSAPLATSVLVCMVAGVSGGWNLAIGYIFTDKADGWVQKAFMDKAFHLMEMEGFNVHALICDGCPANVSLLELYGVKEKSVRTGTRTNIGDIDNFFLNPANQDKVVYLVYDVCHMLKLWRNLLAQCGKISLADGTFIEWKYIVRLYNLQVF